MTTQPAASGVTATPPDEGIPFGTKLPQLAEQRSDDPALTIVARDGTARSMTSPNLITGPINGGGRWPRPV